MTTPSAEKAYPLPAAYQCGRETFLGVELLVAPGVLVPRTETELLGRTSLRRLEAALAGRPPGEPVRLIDMCCGSGNLACAIAAAVPSALVWASDLTEPCAELARRNARHLRLQDRIRVFQGDLFAPLAAEGLEGAADVIVCNPPYISTARLAGRADLQHEPREAFDGGPYGVAVHMRVAREAPHFLRPGGWLLFEVGHGQDRQVKAVLERAGAYEDVELVCDEAADVRVLGARKRKDEG
jgi:release factor glutamine methyltransferase